jgi:hypothetical protein
MIGLLIILAGAAVLTAVVICRFRPVVETPLAEALHRAPGVVRVEVVLPATGRPTRWILHILDYHFVPPELHGRDGYAEHLKRVESVQEEHIALLRWLASKRGVSEVFVEGLTEENLPDFFEKIRTTDELGNVDIPRLLEQLAEARDSGGVGRGLGLERELAVKTDEHRERLLSLGAAGRLCLARKLDVLALEDAVPLERAKPRLVGGRVVTDPVASEDREEAMVRNLLKSGEELMVVMLSAGRDLSESIEVWDPHCGYIRVLTRKVAEIIGNR